MFVDRRKVFRAGMAALMCYLLAAGAALAQMVGSHADEVASQKVEMQLDAVGDAACTAVTRLPSAQYQVLSDARETGLSDVRFVQLAGLADHWLPMDDLKLAFDDKARTITATYLLRGAAREVGDGKWEMRVFDDAISLEAQDRSVSAVFHPSDSAG